MVLMHTPHVETGWPAPRFRLKNVDGQLLTRDDVKGPNGLLVMFICNHCPYVRGIIERLVEDVQNLQGQGIGVVAINANDAHTYPEDSFDNMQKFAQENKFSFPYLYDEDQEIARKFNAVCTPDFFGFDENLHLHYRGRLDDAGKNVFDINLNHKELLPAMEEMLETGRISKAQYPSMGCSIKWKEK